METTVDVLVKPDPAQVMLTDCKDPLFPTLTTPAAEVPPQESELIEKGIPAPGGYDEPEQETDADERTLERMTGYIFTPVVGTENIFVEDDANLEILNEKESVVVDMIGHIPCKLKASENDATVDVLAFSKYNNDPDASPWLDDVTTTVLC